MDSLTLIVETCALTVVAARVVAACPAAVLRAVRVGEGSAVRDEGELLDDYKAGQWTEREARDMIARVTEALVALSGGYPCRSHAVSCQAAPCRAMPRHAMPCCNALWLLCFRLGSSIALSHSFRTS